LTHFDTDELIRRNLVEFREEARLNQGQASDLTGISLDNLRRYESGKSGVPANLLRKFADAYGHATDDFFLAEPPPANLDDRPVFWIRALPGVEVDPAIYAELAAAVTEANMAMAEQIRARKAKASR
jgi:transcriptional regulator with XRE-family HTH domain